MTTVIKFFSSDEFLLLEQITLLHIAAEIDPKL